MLHNGAKFIHLSTCLSPLIPHSRSPAYPSYLGAKADLHPAFTHTHLHTPTDNLQQMTVMCLNCGVKLENPCRTHADSDENHKKPGALATGKAIKLTAFSLLRGDRANRRTNIQCSRKSKQNTNTV